MNTELHISFKSAPKIQNVSNESSSLVSSKKLETIVCIAYQGLFKYFIILGCSEYFFSYFGL